MPDVQPLADGWFDRDLPCLIAAAKWFEEHEMGAPHTLYICEQTGLTPEDVNKAIRNLEAAGIVDGYRSADSWDVTCISDEGLRLSGIWPTPETAWDRLLAALEAQAHDAPDEESRGRFRRAVEALGVT